MRVGFILVYFKKGNLINVMTPLTKSCPQHYGLLFNEPKNQRSEIPELQCAHPLLRVREMQTRENVVIEIEYISF